MLSIRGGLRQKKANTYTLYRIDKLATTDSVLLRNLGNGVAVGRANRQCATLGLPYRNPHRWQARSGTAKEFQSEPSLKRKTSPAESRDQDKRVKSF